MKYKVLAVFVTILMLVGQFVTISPVLAVPNTYYVAKTGDDGTGDGSLGNPWLTIQKGVNELVAGDTLYIRTGTYDEMVTVTIVGDASHWTTIQNYNNEVVNIDGTGLWVPVYVDTSTYLELKGLQAECADGSGFMIVGSSDHITLTNLYAHDCGCEGILIEYDTSGDPVNPVTNILIDSCETYNVCTLVIQEGISLVHVDNFEIKNCHIGYANTQSCLDCKNGCTNGSIHDNEFDEANLYLDGYGHAQTNIEVYNNNFHDFSTGAALSIGNEQSDDAQTNINIYNNLFYNNYRGFMVNAGETPPFTYPKTFTFVNNTMYLNAIAGRTDVFCVDTGTYTDCVIANNIIYMLDPYSRIVVPVGYGVTNDHNLFYNLAETYPVDANHDYGTNAVYGDPLLVNPPTDFRLTVTSPAKDTASATYAPATDYLSTVRPQDLADDIGAYEFTVWLNSVNGLASWATINGVSEVATINGE
jgi:hypothetical protein